MDDGFIQLSTAKLDLFISKNLYFKIDNQFPMVVHSALYGSIERFMFFLLDKYGKFPFWCNKIPFNLINLTGDKKVLDIKINFNDKEKLQRLFICSVCFLKINNRIEE